MCALNIRLLAHNCCIQLYSVNISLNCRMFFHAKKKGKIMIKLNTTSQFFNHLSTIFIQLIPEKMVK